jgi:hypothetical protein
MPMEIRRKDRNRMSPSRICSLRVLFIRSEKQTDTAREKTRMLKSRL